MSDEHGDRDKKISIDPATWRKKNGVWLYLFIPAAYSAGFGCYHGSVIAFAVSAIFSFLSIFKFLGYKFRNKHKKSPK